MADNKGNFMEEYSIDVQKDKYFTFDQYQTAAGKTAVYPDSGAESLIAISYCALGLAGEAGEVFNKIKKLLRDGDSPEKRKEITKEVGDVLWYISRLLKELGGYSMAEIAQGNIEKLLDRRARGVTQGSGDNR